jgi:hypothetical protein
MPGTVGLIAFNDHGRNYSRPIQVLAARWRMRTGAPGPLNFMRLKPATWTASNRRSWIGALPVQLQNIGMETFMSKQLSRKFILLLGVTGVAFGVLPMSFDPVEGVVIVKSAQAVGCGGSASAHAS